MKKISDQILNEDLNVDEFGRLVIKNKKLLDDIRGAITDLNPLGLDDNDTNCGHCSNNNCQTSCGEL